MFLRLLVEMPRWLLVAVIFYAPLAYGCTRPWTIALLELLLAVVLLLWGVGCLARRRWPVLPRTLVAASLLVLVLGWWMSGNAHLEHDDWQHIFVPGTPWILWLPGSVDGIASAEMMWRVTALVGTLLFVCDTAHYAQWRFRLFLAMIASGAVLVGFGLFHRATGLPAGLWPYERFEFATYRYHPNAGAFINLVSALALGFVGWGLRAGGGMPARIVSVAALSLLVAGGFVNASKAAQALMVLVLILGSLWQALSFWRRERRVPWWPILGQALLMALVVGVLVYRVGWQVSLRRWHELGGNAWSNEYRLGAYEVCLDMLKHSGFFGFGPGTFAEVFPHYTERFGTRLAGIWNHAHQDYLEVLVEYGWVGGGGLAILFFGGMWRSLRVAGAIWQCRTGIGSLDSAFAFPMALALLSIALHALIDFPFQVASLQLFTAIILGCAWALRVPSRAAAAEQP